MALATTKTFGQFVLMVEFNAGSGIYSKICGLTSRNISRELSFNETQVPDCDNEDLPAVTQIAPQSKSFIVAGAGVMSQESHYSMRKWFGDGSKLNIRIKTLGATSGQIDYEQGAAYLASYGNGSEKGNLVQADYSIRVDGDMPFTIVP